MEEQRDGRAEVMDITVEGQKEGRAEEGKDRWGGHEKRREAARLIDSHTQCETGKTEGMIGNSKERNKKMRERGKMDKSIFKEKTKLKCKIQFLTSSWDFG